MYKNHSDFSLEKEKRNVLVKEKKNSYCAWLFYGVTIPLCVVLFY